MKQRNLTYDLMRAIAILLVVILHAWTMLGLDQPEWGLLSSAYRAIVDAGVPLFVAISGALLLAESPAPIGEFFSKRFSRVLVPFLIWATILYIIGVVMQQYPDIHTWQDAIICYVPYLVSNKINTLHWFVWMILALYLITPLLQRIISGTDARRIIEYMLVLIWVVILAEWAFPSLYILRYSTPLLGYIAVYLGGYYISRYLSNSQCRWGWIGVGTCFALCLIPSAPTSLLVKWMALSLFMVIKPIELSANRFTAITTAVSRYSYLIYLIHIPFLRAILLVYSPACVEIAPIWIGFSVLTMLSVAIWCADRIVPRWLAKTIGIA